MFASLFSRNRKAAQAVEDALYASIVAAARQPAFYADWDVADTPLGRFEMLALHMVLMLRRLDQSGEAALAQNLTDGFFQDVDHSLRELGIGDKGVPRRMKTLSQMFYGRAVAYGNALGEKSLEGLADALSRNVWPEAAPAPHASAIAAYALKAGDALAAETDASLLSGTFTFPNASDPAEAAS